MTFTARRRHREIEERRKAKARELAELAVRGDYDAPKYVLALLGKGDLAAYLAKRGKPGELDALLATCHRRRKC